MSEVTAFCQRHGISSLQNLLNHCGPTTSMRELFSLKVLEDLLANDPEKLSELSKIRSRIHPVEMRAAFRATVKQQDAEILAARNKKRDLESKIKRLESALRRMRAAPVVAPEPYESQAYDEGETQPPVGGQDGALKLAGRIDEADTQMDNFDQDAALKLAGRIDEADTQMDNFDQDAALKLVHSMSHSVDEDETQVDDFDQDAALKLVHNMSHSVDEAETQLIGW